MKIRMLFPDNLQDPVGGLAFVAQKLKDYLVDKVEFEFIGQPQKEPMEGYKEASFPLDIKHGGLNSLTGQITYFAHAVDGDKPDIIHAFDWSVYLAGVYASRHYGVPLLSSMQLSANLLSSIGINYCHDSRTIDGNWISESHKQIEKAGLYNADKIIHVSKAHSDSFREFSDKSVVIPNGVDMKDFDTKETFKLPGKNKLKVLYIGRFDPMKGINNILGAEIPDGIDLIFAGGNKGSHHNVFSSVLKYCQEKENAYYIGPVFGEKKAALMNAVDAVLFPSIYEPFGIVGLEAFATKSVLLTTRAYGISDYANNDNSIYCGYDSGSVSMALKYMADVPSEKIEKLKSNGIKTAKKFNWKDSVKKYLEVYQSLVE